MILKDSYNSHLVDDKTGSEDKLVPNQATGKCRDHVMLFPLMPELSS